MVKACAHTHCGSFEHSLHCPGTDNLSLVTSVPDDGGKDSLHNKISTVNENWSSMYSVVMKITDFMR